MQCETRIVMKTFLLVLLSFSICQLSAQVDTITTKNLKLNLSKVGALKHSYAVFFTDSLGNRTSTADIWDREVNVVKKSDGKSIYTFEWKWYNKDSLFMSASAICKYPSLDPLEYNTIRKKQKRIVRYENNVASVEGKSRKTQRDTTYQVNVGLNAFAFPMDLEIFA